MSRHGHLPDHLLQAGITGNRRLVHLRPRHSVPGGEIEGALDHVRHAVGSHQAIEGKLDGGAVGRQARFFTILSSNNAAILLSERRNDMKTEDELTLRREVRDAVFRTERMHRAGRPVEADEQRSGELAAAQARLAELGCPDPAGTLLHWRSEDEAAYALAELVADLVTERSRRQAAPPAAPTSPASTPRSGDSATPQYAFPSPPTDVPALADLLDDMLSRESRARR